LKLEVILVKQVVKSYTESELLGLAVAFHGHLGPYLVLGLKAGELANKIMGKEPFKTRAEVFSPPQPPHSCIVDGVQFSTGCTMGKANILLHGSKKRVKVIFTKEGRSLEVSPKRSILQSFSSMKGDAAEDMSEELYRLPLDELFDYKIKNT
jgi:formylmethanofuran dehydrogenase subunit E